MATNNFKPFATAANANVTAQADWESLPALLSGFTAGKASSAQVNKAIRQASFIAAALAQYTANKSGLDVLDDGDLNGFIAKMSAAFGKDFQALDATLTALAGLTTGANKLPYFTGTDTASQTDLTSVGRDIIGKSTIADILTYLGVTTALAGKQPLDATLTALAGLATGGNKLPYFTGTDTASQTDLTSVGRDIIGKDTIADILTYLQLGEAAKRDVGTGNNQLPDMSAFGMSRNGQTAWDILPNGMLRQVGTVTLTPVGNFNPQVLGGVTYYTHYYRVNFPRQFPNAQIATLATLASAPFSNQTTMAGKSLATHRDTDSGTEVSRTRFTVAYTTPNLGEIPILHFESIGY